MAGYEIIYVLVFVFRLLLEIRWMLPAVSTDNMITMPSRFRIRGRCYDCSERDYLATISTKGAINRIYTYIL